MGQVRDKNEESRPYEERLVWPMLYYLQLSMSISALVDVILIVEVVFNLYESIEMYCLKPVLMPEFVNNWSCMR